MARRRRRGLGSPSAQHSKQAEVLLGSAERHLKGARKGSCSIRFTSLTAAIDTIARARSQAFHSGGKVARGAVTPKTVSTETAKRIYSVSDDVDRAASEFRGECIKHDVAGLGRARRRR